MTSARAIAPLDLPDVVPAAVPDALPEMTWIRPEDLIVDERYQRALSDRSLKLVRKIVAEFSWAKFKAPTAVWTDVGLEVVDGQHSAVAAACHPGISEIPVLVVSAPELTDRAGGFVAINRDRLQLTPTQLHVAAVVAGDEGALAVERVCAGAGMRVRKAPPGGRTQFAPRETNATVAIHGMIARCGEALAIEMLKIVAEAELAPVGAAHIRAVEHLITDQEFADAFDPAELTKTIVNMGAEADREARVFAGTHCVPLWRGLAAAWFRKVKKRKPAKTTTEPEPAAEPSSKAMPLSSGPLPRTRTSFEPVAYSAGDPPPGRSALDQKKAATR